MNIEIYGTGAHNAGAELMAYAISDWFRHQSPDVKCAVDSGYGDFEQRAEARLWTIVAPAWYSRSGVAMRLLPRPFHQTHGLLFEPDIQVVLDASGFAYGDQWGVKPSRALLHHAVRWRRQGRRIVLLPQSFGPFRTPGLADNLKRIASHVDAIYARDATSFDALQALDLQTEVRNAPDFTVHVSGYVPTSCNVRSDTALIVPNRQVIHKGGDHDGGAYLDFLSAACQALWDRGLQVRALCHSPGDQEVIDRLNQRLSDPLPVVHERHPLALKGVLGLPAVVIASRFHALVSAMLQAVPVIGVGWSHKYQHLFDDFGISEYLLTTDVQREEFAALLDKALHTPERKKIEDNLRDGATRYARQAATMWQEVEELIGLPGRQSAVCSLAGQSGLRSSEVRA